MLQFVDPALKSKKEEDVSKFHKNEIIIFFGNLAWVLFYFKFLFNSGQVDILIPSLHFRPHLLTMVPMLREFSRIVIKPRTLLSPVVVTGAFFFAVFFFAWLRTRYDDCSRLQVNLAYSLSTPSLHFPKFNRPISSIAHTASASVDVVYVTAFPTNAITSLRSLCYFAGQDTIGTVHFIIPDRMLSFFTSAEVLNSLQCHPESAWPGQAPRFLFKIWPESNLVSRFIVKGHYSGTTRQMLLKLAIAFYVETPFFLVMDSDVYARRRFNRSDLFDAETQTKSRVNMDQTDPVSQPAKWINHASRVLDSQIVADTDNFCASASGTALEWYKDGKGKSIPENPFELFIDDKSGRLVFGACRNGRSHSSHVTPYLYARDIIIHILVPRIEKIGEERLSRQVSSPLYRHREKDWQSILLDYQDDHNLLCPYYKSRLYSWTEHSLYFIAGVASQALEQYHSFSGGGITSIGSSMFFPREFENADWRAIFQTHNKRDDDSRPFFIIHSWFNKDISETISNMADSIPTLRKPFPVAPSPEPFY